MAITRSDVLNKTFTRNYLGYDDTEVDDYLLVLMGEIEATRAKLNEVALINKKLCEEMQAFNNEKAEWEEKRVQTEKYVKGLLENAENKKREVDAYAKQSMLDAQEKAKQIERAAENKAAETVYMAEEKALGVVHSIEDRERQIIEKAQRKAQDIINEARIKAELDKSAEPWQEWMK